MQGTPKNSRAWEGAPNGPEGAKNFCQQGSAQDQPYATGHVITTLSNIKVYSTAAELFMHCKFGVKEKIMRLVGLKDYKVRLTRFHLATKLLIL